MKSFITIIITALSITTSAFAMQKEIIRKPLLTALLPSKEIQRVEVKEINFASNQETGLHMHPCPVVGYIVTGRILFQVDGQPAKILRAGDAFYEPAHTKIIHFDNASSSEPLKFIAFYLLNTEDKELINMLKS